MKVVVTGATGFIGGEVLKQCVQNASISHIVVLSRRQLPDAALANNSKITTIIMDDFSTYSDSVMTDLKDADACIWALGVYKVQSAEHNRQVNNEWTMAALRAFSSVLAPKPPGDKKFRFLYVSGHFVESAQDKKLWFMEENRKIRGQGETEFASFGKENSSSMEVYVARPGAVMNKGIGASVATTLGLPAVQVDYLAAATIDIILNGSKEQYLDTWALQTRGKEVKSK